jgi:hypothetical protein
MWILFGVLLLGLIIIVSIVILFARKPNAENPSIMDITKTTTIEIKTEESPIAIATTSESLETKILTTETIKITTSRGIVLLNYFQNYLLFNLKYFIRIMI